MGSHLTFTKKKSGGNKKFEAHFFSFWANLNKGAHYYRGLVAQWIMRLTTDQKIPGLLDGVLVAQKYVLGYWSKKMPSTTPNYSKGSPPVEKEKC